MFDTEHFDSEATDVLTEIGEVYADEFDAPVTILTASLGDGMIIGQLMSGGNIYNYAADGNEIGFDYSPEDSEEVNEYARGFLESSYGIKTDSMDSPYEYAFGFVRLDAQVKCKKGGVACGKVCLPKGAKCKKYSGAGNAGAMSQAAGRLKSPGRVAAGIGAGLAGAAAVAGGAGYLAYKNRDKLGEPGRKLGVIGTRVKAAAREGKEEFMSGVNNAKEILKAGQKASKSANSFMSEVQGDERLTRKEKYKANQVRKSLSAAAAGGGAAGAVGAVAAGTENAINAVKYNLTRNPKFGSEGSKSSDRPQSKSPNGGLPGSKIGQKLLQGRSGEEKPSRILVTPAGKDKNPRVLVTPPSKEGESFPVEGTRGFSTAKALPGSKIGQKLLQGRSGEEKPSRILVTPAGKDKNPRVLVTPPSKEGESFPVEGTRGFSTAKAITATTKAAAEKKKQSKSFTQRKVEKYRRNQGK